MTSDIDTSDTIETLGQLLHKARLQHDIDLEELADETKISLANLQAMENDDYAALPAVTFARGMYTIYAKTMGLDVEDVLSRFSEESTRGLDKNSPTPTPSILAKKVGTMAERPPAPPTSLFGLIFLVFLVLVALGCWYYAINPATYISKKLRGLETSSSQLEPGEPAEAEPVKAEAPAVKVTPEEPAPEVAKPSDPQAGSVSQDPAGPRYTLQATFHELAEIEISVDDSLSQQLTISSGRKLTWTAEQSIELVLPAKTTTQLSLNGKMIKLPAAEDGKVTVAIPEILFE